MKIINPERRKFFTKFGLGALSTSILSIVPFKLFASSSEKKHSEQKVSIVINPLAVKRTKK